MTTRRLSAPSVDPGCWELLHDGTGATFRVTVPEADVAVLRELWVDERNDYQLHAEQLRNGGTVLDLGAHVGLFTLLALVHGARHVVAVEPIAENYDLLVQNLDDNNDRVDGEAICVNAAVGLPVGRPLFVTGVGSCARFAVGHDECPAPPAAIPEMTLDELLAVDLFVDRHGLTDVNVVKVDIEGSEYELFEQASDAAILACRRIVMEFHGVNHAERQSERFGRLVARLGETHRITFFGRTSVGGLLWADRYGGGAA